MRTQLLLFFLILPVLAAPLHQIDIEIHADSFIETLRLSDIGATVSLDLPPGDVQLLDTNSHCQLGTRLECELTDGTLQAKLLVRNAGAAGYLTNNDRGKMFRFSYTPSQQSQIKLKVSLPQGATFADKPFSFPPAQIGTDGQVMYAEWSMDSSAGEEFSSFLLYREPSNYLWLLGVILVAAGIVLFIKSREVGKQRVIKVLSQDERAVHDMISSNKGELDQKQVVKQTGWSKSKVSQIVRNLEGMGIISKHIKGRKNLLKLKL